MMTNEQKIKSKSILPWWVIALLILAVALIALIAFLIGNSMQSAPEVVGAQQPTYKLEQVPVIVPSPEEIAMNCHTLTAHSADRNRRAAGVSDADIAPGLAIEACEKAVAAIPGDAVLLFELGRALWVGGRELEAVSKFAEAAELNHAGAMKYIGDAYVEGRGLPPNVDANIQEGANWYRKSSEAGFADADFALQEAERQIARNTFDPQLFQNGKFMKYLYDGDFSTVEAPLALAYYTKGVVQGLDSNETIFLDQSCKAMIGKIGSVVVNVSEFAGVFKQFADSGKNNEDPLSTILKVVVQAGTESIWIDQGRRDATVLYNKDVLGCDSAVTKSVVSNIMVTSNNNRAF